MNFIMTGHKGLIGSFLLEKLKKEGHKPILLIDLREGQNIIDLDKIELKEKVDIMIHLAAFCKINKAIANPDFAFENNVLGTYKVLEFCRKNNIPKIVYTSSSRVLEDEKNPYTASKIYGEELCKGYCDCYNINYVIIRPSTVYGPFNDKTARLVDIFIRNALENKELQIFGDKSKTLDFTYINDFIAGFILAMEQKNKEFDIATGKGTRLIDVAEMIIKYLGSKSKIVFLPSEKAQPQNVELDIRAMKEIGYSPKISIEDGLRRTMDWYHENIITYK